MSRFPSTRLVTALVLLASSAVIGGACTDGPGARPGHRTPDTGPGAIDTTVTATAETRSFSQAVVSVALSAPSGVAAACVRRDDPTEVHLLEADGADAVDLHFAGLLPSTDYDCKVAPTDTRGPSTSVSFRTADAPAELASAEVIRDGSAEMTGAYTVMNVRQECDDSNQNNIVVVDPDGNNRFRYELPKGTNIGIEVLPDGKDRFLWGGGKGPNGAPAVVDVRAGETWRLEFPGSDQLDFHHDVNRIEDGRVLSVEDIYDPGWAAFRLRLSDEAGQTSWLWDVQSAVASGWLDAGSDEEPDPHHLNWADVVETDRGLVAYGSLCFDFKVVAIDVESSQPLWKFGYGGDFTLVDAAGNTLPDQEDFPQCQHGLQTDGTHLFMFDNGFDRGWTRAVEYTLDLDRMTAHKSWEWLDEGFFERYHGGVDWLTPDHQRVLVAEGNNDCGDVSDRRSQVVEIDRATGAEVHRLILKDVRHWLYRAHRVDGCDVFANAKYCPTLADRLVELGPVLGL